MDCPDVKIGIIFKIPNGYLTIEMPEIRMSM